MDFIKKIVFPLSLIFIFTLNVNAQSKKSPLAILADELDPKETPTPELDDFQRLEAQLDAYDQQRAKHLQEEKEEEMKQKATLVRGTPTPNPDLLACNTLQEGNDQILSYVKNLQDHWKKFDVEINKKGRELTNLNAKMKQLDRSNKELFVSSDMEWIKNVSDNSERMKKTYDSDMKRYKEGIDVKIENSVCDIKKGCNTSNKNLKKFIAICKKWQSDKNIELNKIEIFAKEKQQKMLNTYTGTINQINKLHEKRNYELHVKKGKI